ncbi:MAG: hypothetical protein HKM93_00715 [Desulfobacteraceae bacterium]|nr:hypothetical protein [Desulfobacteraceae bacterium]
MNIKKHLVLITVVCVAWAVFYLIGLSSDYFLTWTTAEQMLITWMGFFSILPFFCFFVVVFLGGDYFKTSLWFAFYASVELFAFDYVVVGLIEGQGLGFLMSHWYLTIGYFEAWIVMPLVGSALMKFKEASFSGQKRNTMQMSI